MNTDDILNALNEVDDTCIQNAREPKKKLSRKALWISAGAVAAACLLVALQLPHMLRQTPHNDHIHHDGYCDCQPDLQITPTPAVSKEFPLGIAYSGDFRERNNFVINSKDSYLEWPWEYLFICDQYPVVEYNDVTYRSRTFFTGDNVSETWIGQKLTNAVADVGYSPEFEKTTSFPRTIPCEIYELKGIATDRFFAVKYEGHKEYYVFMQDRLNPPATLGDLITKLNLTETFPLTAVSFPENASERYSLSDADSSAFWELFLQHADRNTITTDFAYSELNLGKNVMTFTINTEALGLYNGAWTLTSGGYLSTNIEDYGYYYYLGEEAVNEIIEVVSSRKKSALLKQDFSLIGEVTEITDTYIKVDDSLCMKNPAEGLEFTVELNDLRLKRYVACNRLNVGDHVWIRHIGTEAATPTHIATAYELNIGRIDASGTIYIKE